MKLFISNIIYEEAKTTIIKHVYYGDVDGYGPIHDTYIMAETNDTRIYLSDVNVVLNHIKERQNRTKPKDSNSFINPRPLLEIETYPIDMGPEIPTFFSLRHSRHCKLHQQGMGVSEIKHPPWQVD